MPPELKFENIRFQVYRGVRLESAGSAVTANFRRDTTALGANGIKVHFPADPHRGAADLSASWGRGSLRPREFTAGGGVDAQRKNEQATTEEAHYSDQDGLVRGDRPIVIRGQNYTLKGPGFTMDPKTGVMDVTGGAHVEADEGKAR